MQDFYLKLPVLTDFASLANESNYSIAPSDWWVILTDIQGSTKAIHEGRYKDVNTLGAASISAAQNALDNLEFPFVFGGDGATLLVPNGSQEIVLETLAGLQDIARLNFGLILRLGFIQISELEKHGAHIKVAKFAVSESCVLAEFYGNGLQVAEEFFKEEGSRLEYCGSKISDPNLNGLSCRWKPLTSRNGVILSVIIEARTEKGLNTSATFNRVIQQLEAIFSGGMESANPALGELRGYRSAPTLLREERRYQKRRFTFSGISRAIEILIAGCLFNFKVPIPKLRRYVEDIPSHCDFRKFDSSFRAVLDCSYEQAQAIEFLLQNEYSTGTLYFGIHRSDEAMMTCLVEGLKPGEHLHFIDGSGGGYTLAAKQMKMQKVS